MNRITPIISINSSRWMTAWYVGLAQPSWSYTAPPTISMPIAPETKTVPAATKSEADPPRQREE